MGHESVRRLITSRLLTGVSGSLLFLVLVSGPALAVGLCQETCSSSTECWEGCWTDDPFLGEFTTCGEYGRCIDGTPPVYDMVEWMQQTYPGATTTHLAQVSGGVVSEFTGCTFTNGFYRTGKGGESHELFTYDNTWINIWREVFDASESRFKTHDNFHWVRRHMSPGQCFTADCAWRLHEGSCTPPSETPCSTISCLEGPVMLSLGGDIGTVEAVIRTFIQGNGNKEKYFYAKPYGMVMVELRAPNGSLIHNEIFNQIVSGEITPNPSACFSLDC